MYSKYIFVGVYAFSGGLIYNGINNLFLEPNVYEGKKSIFNFGMLIGLTLGSYYYFL